MKRLTDRQAEVLDFIREHIRRRGYPPTVREIGQGLGILWPAASAHLKALEKKGEIRITPSVSRGIELVGHPGSGVGYDIGPGGIGIPLAGSIRAGRPIPAIEDISARITIDRSLFPAEDAFALRVKGDSMKDAGIMDGDYVVVRPQGSVRNGEIGVALIGNEEATVKRIFQDSGVVILRPENPAMEPASYDPEDVSIIGRVIGVIRKL